MLSLKYKHVLDNLDYFCEKTYEDKEPICIELPDSRQVVLLSKEQYDELIRPSN